MFKSNTTGLETPLNYIYIYIYTYIQQQQQVLQKCTGPRMARANLGGPVNLSVGNAQFLFFYVHVCLYVIQCGNIIQRGELRIYSK